MSEINAEIAAHRKEKRKSATARQKEEMIRVVLDTNVVVAAALTPVGPSFRILELVTHGLVQAWVSPSYPSRIRRGFEPEQDWDPAAGGQDVAGRTSLSSELVTPSKRVTLSPDPDDNVFLECAEAALKPRSNSSNRTAFLRRAFTRPHSLNGDLAIALQIEQ